MTKSKKRSLLDKITITLRVFVFAGIFLFIGAIVLAGIYRFVSPPGTLLMVERKLSGDVIIHPWVPIDSISPNLVVAVIAAEDTRFCLHNGIDMKAINEAMEEAKNGKRQRGASTISQQTAKNVFLTNGGGWMRKGAEAWMTVVIETLWPKRRIMEVYLNVAEWGDGLFGAEAAAQKRFGKSAKHLTAHEAALLASVLPNPHKWRVDPPGPYVRKRVGDVSARMGQVRRDGLDDCVNKP
ncbi:MAG: monofunctional biosynthetic peptidoglycan transglycosylase [Marinicaulis sp.]|nr:monofunctional biosynthetic peptidoglycan transglycosylase [Marinicaulis sp.]NNE40328.1 monofunctional biosynthetic peptidoglycan transglycosylase [Marinicaulis sp.]NNL88212.1 monofunctional biosynthetic peptidoglycan transglycosylase [Marinicaulis sp.]